MKRTRLVSIASAVLVVVPASACASSGPSARPPRVGPEGQLSGRSDQAGNKAAAEAEAALLVSKAVLIPGATPTTSRPPGLTGPAMGIASSSQQVDKVAYFRVARSLEQTDEWFDAHDQPGLVDSGSSNGGGPSGPTSYGFEYDPHGQTGWSWGTASLQISIAPEGASATGIRVDGVAQWIDPTPARDMTVGRGVRLTVAHGCPATDSGVHDVINPGAPDLNHQLLPTAAPTAALECTYDGLNGSPFRLSKRRVLTAARALAEARKIRALPLGQRGTGAIHCPMDDGRVTALAFAYAGRPDVDIWEYTSGCPFTDNGYIVSRGF